MLTILHILSIKDWLVQFQQWSELDTPQMQWIAAAIGISSAGALWLGRRIERLMTRRAYKKNDDQGHHGIVERLIIRPKSNGRFKFDRETDKGALPLEELLDSDYLCAIVRKALKHGDEFGRINLLPADHALLMSRIDAHITGNEPAASQAAMFGRDDEYYEDETWFLYRNITGDDGVEMLHFFLMSGKYAARLTDPDFRKKLDPRRQRYGKRYFPLLESIGDDFELSVEKFATINDEDEAGKVAPCWSTIIRTQRIPHLFTLEQVGRMIAEAVAKALGRERSANKAS